MVKAKLISIHAVYMLSILAFLILIIAVITLALTPKQTETSNTCIDSVTDIYLKDDQIDELTSHGAVYINDDDNEYILRRMEK